MNKTISLVTVALIVVSTFAMLAPQTKAEPETIICEDDFESYTIGAFPSPPWEWWFSGAGSTYNKIVDTVLHSPDQSLAMLGQPGWASVAAVELPYTSDVMGYEVWVRAANYGSGIGAEVGFNYIKYGAIWDHWAGAAFRYDGWIVSGSTLLEQYDLDTWYKIRVIADLNAKTYSVWINDVLKGADLEDADPADPKTQLQHFGLASDHGEQQCYFDDVEVFEIAQPPVDELYPLPAGAKPFPSGTDLLECCLLIDLDTEGSGQVVYAEPDQTLSASCTFQRYSGAGNPSEISQAFFIMSWTPSWPAPEGYYIPIYHGMPGVYPGVTRTTSFSFTGPSTPGTYYLYWCHEAHYSMRQAVNSYDQPLDLPAHAKIIVGSQEEWELRMLQLIDDIAEAKQAALELSTFNLDEGVDVCGNMIAEVAGDVAGLIFSEIVLPDLDVEFKELPKHSQEILLIINAMVSEMTEETLGDPAVASTTSLDIMKSFAEKTGFSYCTDLSQLSTLYQDDLDSITSFIHSAIDDWRTIGPPSDLDLMASQWSKVLTQYTNSLEEARSKATFYISPMRIGTMGQAAEAIEWWDSPLHEAANLGLLALSATAILFGQMQFLEASKILKVTKDIGIMFVWWEIMQSLVIENHYMLTDFEALIWKHIMPSLWHSDLYSEEPGDTQEMDFPPVSFSQKAVEGHLKYNYNWPKALDIRVSIAFFDPEDQLLYWSLSELQSSEDENLEFRIEYYFPGLYYLIKYARNPKMFLKVFIHHMDADGQGFDTDYLSGPFEVEVKVQAFRIVFTAECPVDLLVTAANGLSVGYDPEKDIVFNEVEGAFYSGVGTEPQVIAIPSPLAGSYSIDILGTGTGPYTITVESVTEDGFLSDTMIWNGEISSGELHRDSVQLSEDNVLSRGPPERALDMLLSIVLVSAGIIAASAICFCVSRSRRKKDQ